MSESQLLTYVDMFLSCPGQQFNKPEYFKSLRSSFAQKTSLNIRGKGD